MPTITIIELRQHQQAIIVHMLHSQNKKNALPEEHRNAVKSMHVTKMHEGKNAPPKAFSGDVV